MEWPVHPPEGLDGPPSNEEGTVTDVREKRTMAGRSDMEQTCEHCGAAILVRESHVGAVVRLTWGGKAHYRRPVFCDWDCWQGWARQ